MKDDKKKSASGGNSSIPEGMQSVTPYFICNEAANLISFIEKTFGGNVMARLDGKDDKVMHATMTIGESIIMIADASEKYAAMPIMVYVYVDDVDAVYKKAIAAKGVSLREPVDEFYGDRSAGIQDPWGNQWWIATHVEDISNEEIEKRAEEFQKQEA